MVIVVAFEILWNGQTPGKRWVGLKGHQRKRAAPRIVDQLPVDYGRDVTVFLTQRNQRLGDLSALTLVVHYCLTHGRVRGNGPPRLGTGAPIDR